MIVLIVSKANHLSVSKLFTNLKIKTWSTKLDIHCYCKKFHATASGAPLFLYDASQDFEIEATKVLHVGYHKNSLVTFNDSENEEREDVSSSIKWKFCTQCNSRMYHESDKLPGVLVFTVSFSTAKDSGLVKEGQTISRGDIAQSNIF